MLVSCVQTNSYRATVLYNHTAVHAIPAAMNLMTRALLQQMINSSAMAMVRASIWPWPEQELFDKHKFVSATMMMVVIGLVLTMVVPTFATEIVRDRKVSL